ncbi:hypothetical protein ABZT06_46785 [Streptomyces sp. NPDC005483]
MWREATEEIMAAVTALLAEVRGLPAPSAATARRPSPAEQETSGAQAP